MLSRHTLIVAAIFVPYFGFMASLGIYIWHTGRHRGSTSNDDTGSRPLAAMEA